MEHQEFDDFSRVFATSGSRRGAVGALVELLGLGLLGAQEAEGKSKQKRRRQRRRTKQGRRKDKRGAQGLLRGIKVTVGNPLTNNRAIDVELGFGTGGPGPRLKCCQGQAAYTLELGESREYATAETEAYLWVENRYFIKFRNEPIVLPFVNWAIGGATAEITPWCCKPHGETLGSGYELYVGETKVLNFHGRLITVQRLADEPDYKVFFVTL